MKNYFAELVGTFVLVFGGVGSAVFAGKHIGFEGVAFAFGLSLLAMVYTIGPIPVANSTWRSRLECCSPKKSAAKMLPCIWSRRS